eukprot:CAMPEP_0185834334 /NCGR_PEP_ID=MMETSP1353-20130828/5086_1 /TAXON_ID=1077150 /ORGANISM="Erythrolobus australicus, Strain CCMP3124" /LENGTH=323 /DNA_ID=CAMNT_0028532745 /DNA_START=235 /DNA_END=1206 /DNA_ORIENTATION=+
MPVVDDRDAQLVRKARAGGPKVVEKLLDSGADPNATINGATPLCEAAATGAIDTVFLLLDRGAEPNKADGSGKSPLHVAALGGHVETMQMLLQSGADPAVVDKRGNTPLHEAARSNAGGPVRAMLQQIKAVHVWPLISTRNEDGETALHTAARTGNAQAVKELVVHSALEEAQVAELLNAQNARGQTALLQATQKAKHAQKCIAILVVYGADASIADHKGASPGVAVEHISDSVELESSNDGELEKVPTLTTITPRKARRHLGSVGTSADSPLLSPSPVTPTGQREGSAVGSFFRGFSRKGSKTPREVAGSSMRTPRREVVQK